MELSMWVVIVKLIYCYINLYKILKTIIKGKLLLKDIAKKN